MRNAVRPFVVACLIAIALCVPVPRPALADLGSCAAYDAHHQHQGGSEHSLTTTSRGVSAVITVRTSDLCNGPIVDPNGVVDSGTTAYVMLTDESNLAGVWYQIGYYRIPGDTCVARAYTQRKIDGGQRFDQAGPCLTSGTQYQFRLEKLHDDLGYYWRASIIRWSDSVMIWDAPGDPSSSSPGFTIADGEYQYEVINEHDQSGGGNATRAKLASAYYWDTNFNAVPADMSGGELHCDDCDPFGPYNTNWLNTRTFEDWTDGF